MKTIKTPILEKDVVDVVDPAVAPEAAAPVRSSRDDMMDSIVAKRNQEISADLDSFNQDAAVNVELDLSDGEGDDGQQAQSEDKTKPEQDDTDLSGKGKKVIVKIDGVSTEVTPEEIREYQANRAADLRLREAADRKRVLDQRESELTQREAEMLKRSDIPALVDDPDMTDAELKALADKLIRNTFAEDADGTAQVLQEILKKRRTQQAPAQQAQLSDEDISSRVEHALYRKDQKKAIQRFETDYPFLAKNMRDVVNERSKTEWENDPEAPVWEIIQRSAEHVKKEIAKEFGATEPAADAKKPASDLDAKRQMKAGVGSTVKSSVAVKSALPGDEAPVPQTAAQSFKELQRARGQS